MKKVVFFGLLLSLILAIGISHFASESPDGLERVAHDKGFIEKSEEKKVINAPLPDYQIPGIKNPGLSTPIAGAIGTIAVFSVTYLIGYLLRKKKRNNEVKN